MQLPNLRETMERALAGHRLLDHPFYRRWEAGGLGQGELAAYAAQYRHFEALLPGFLGELAGRLGPGPAGDAIRANLADELGDPLPHLELFDRFAAAVGAQMEPPGPAARALADAYGQTLAAGAPCALAGLLAYESQAPAVAATKARGLRDHYGVPAPARAFWEHHATVDLAHARWSEQALAAQEAPPDLVEAAASLVARAWWGFLDEREAVAA